MLESFELSWRFTDPNYNLLCENDLSVIHTLSKSECIEIWDKYDLSKLFCANGLINYKSINKYLFIDDCFWGEKDDSVTANILLNNVNVDDEIYFFWTKYCAVSTNYDIFVKYWSDFCYPSDYRSVLLYVNNFILIYKEDMFYKLPWEAFSNIT